MNQEVTYLTINLRPNCAIRFLPCAVQGAGVGSSRLRTKRHTVNPDIPVSG